MIEKAYRDYLLRSLKTLTINGNHSHLSQFMTQKTIPLTELKPGQSAVVQGFSPNLAADYQKFLQHLGVVQQTSIRLVRRAPLGDPLQLEIRGSQFGLRATEACHIYVTFSN